MSAEAKKALERRRRALNDAIERIRVNSPEFSAADNWPREELHGRARARAERQMADSTGPERSRVANPLAEPPAS